MTDKRLPFSPYLYCEWESPNERKCQTMFTEKQMSAAYDTIEQQAKLLDQALEALGAGLRYFGLEEKDTCNCGECMANRKAREVVTAIKQFKEQK